jgi:hypothetical protein
MRIKTIILLSGTQDGWQWQVPQITTKKGNIRENIYFNYIDKANTRKKYIEKTRIRDNDNKWVRNYIPSSIWWKTEIHHDWKDGGRMYLLTKGEHILRHRREK